ncbi:MAG: NAD(P)H-hydrate dehydratase [Phyllobacterium sp.]|uniref:NAD(P)H-hydrate dehydratase n=1 Tax=Phyllobacterium sp. TaxID=1871046 RepID=UPI0030F2B4F0
MAYEILTPAEMSEADRLTITAGPGDGYTLMLRAGEGIARYLLATHGDAIEFHILCGPGNNGGDGYVIARALIDSGNSVHVWSAGPPKPASDAARALADYAKPPRPIEGFTPKPASVVIDALFGAGLDRPVTGKAAAAIERANQAAVRRIAVDVPSGLDGATGQALGTVFQADCTITFFKKKPGHLLYPGRTLCGDLIVHDIGISDDVLSVIAPRCFENAPGLWRSELPSPEVDTHKYRRGHVAVFSGGATSTGAARLSALAAARSGAGAVTVLSPGEALAVNAAHLTSIMLSRCDHEQDLADFIDARNPSTFVIGPGFGIGDKTRRLALTLLGQKSGRFVFDADTITSFKDRPDMLFAAAQGRPETRLMLTPHEGEFKRLFPDLDAQAISSKLERARAAAARANAIIVYKGADTVIAAPDGRAVINSNGTPLLATAGSGDVLSGLTAGLMAQGMPPFEAACAAVHVHGEAAHDLGFGLIAEDLPQAAGKIMAALMENLEKE